MIRVHLKKNQEKPVEDAKKFQAEIGKKERSWNYGY